MTTVSGSGKRGINVSVLLAVCLSFLLSPALSAAGGVISPCSLQPASVHMQEHGTGGHACACCKHEKGARSAPCALEAKCSPARGHEFSVVSSMGAQIPVLGAGPSPMSPNRSAAKGREAPKNVCARETTYLINLKLLC